MIPQTSLRVDARRETEGKNFQEDEPWRIAECIERKELQWKIITHAQTSNLTLRDL